MFCGGGGAIVTYGIVKESGSLSAQVRRYRAAGLPWVAADLAPNVPADQNAASLLNSVLAEALPMINDGGAAQAALQSNQIAKAQAILGHYKGTLDLTVQATDKAGLDWRPDWDQGYFMRQPETWPLRPISRLLGIRSQLEVAEGHVDLACADLSAIGRLAALVNQESDASSLVDAEAIDSNESTSTVRCSGRLAGNAAALEKLAAATANGRLQPDVMRSLRGDAYMGVATARNLLLYLNSFLANEARWSLGNVSAAVVPQITPHVDPSKLLRQGLPDDEMARANLTGILKFWADAVEQTSGDKDPRSVCRRLKALSEQSLKRLPVGSFLMGYVCPPFDWISYSVTEAEANRVACQALIQALIVHARTGRYPAEIGQVPGGPWIDPFKGWPLKLKLTQKGIRVYSVGRTGVDHGGLARSEVPQQDGYRDAYDIVAAYPPVPSRAAARPTGLYNGRHR